MSDQKNDANTDALFPVILSVPEEERHFTGREKVLALSWHARRALQVSAQKSRLILGNLPKDPDGVPLPIDGTYWSLTHKSNYVGAVVSRSRIGIDIEEIKPISPALFRKTAHNTEWFLGDKEDGQLLFFRYWTAKEAILKASGTGVSDLLKCRIMDLADPAHLTASYQERQWIVEHFIFNGHIASVVQNTAQVQWTLL
jgi:4'-phosphopantetheinyl transferase